MRSKGLRSLRPVLVLVGLLWAIEVANAALGHRPDLWLGLEPRTVHGLVGIPLMPLLHSGFSHLAANTLPVIFLGGLGMVVAPRRFPAATVAIVLGSGLAVWLLGRPHSVHVGASGLIFGWFGYLLALGFLERSARAIAGSVLVIAVYGGMVWGLLPQRGLPVSWEAHVFGALAGVAVAHWQRPQRR